MINLKIFYKKEIRNYGVIILILFTLILLLVNFAKCIDFQKKEDEDSDIYKTLIMTPKEDWDYTESFQIYKDNIEEYNINKETEECYIKFDSRDNLKKYLNEYEGKFSKISISDFSLDSKYNTIKNITLVLINVCVFIILFIILIFSINIVSNLEKDISLYKLLGFKNRSIIFKIISFIYIYYFIIFLLSILLTRIIYFIFKLESLKNILGINNILILNVSNYVLIWLCISIFIVVSFIRVIYKIKKMTPIKLINSNAGE